MTRYLCSFRKFPLHIFHFTQRKIRAIMGAICRILGGDRMNGEKIAHLKYICALLLFGSNGIIAAQIPLTSTEIVVLRSFFGTVVLLVILAATRQKLTCLRRPRQAALVAVSGAAMGASWLLLYRAYELIGVSIATLLYYCGPIFVMALSPIFFKEKLTIPKITGIIAVFCGVIMLNGVSGGTLDTRGFLCGIGGAALYTLMVITNKKAGLPGLENSVMQLLTAFLTVALFHLCRGGAVPYISRESWGWVLLLGLVNTGLGCWLYFSSIRALPVQTVSILGYLEPLSAVLFSVVLLHEMLTPWRWVGAALIVGGAMAAEFIKGNKTAK